MTKIAITVIVPVYNASKYIGDCIESILAQTFIDYELILINDGSRDDSGAICDLYAAKDSRIHVIHTPNRGVSAARNTGLDSAVGGWVAFVDADDTVGRDYLKQLYGGAGLVGDCARTLVLCGFRIRSRDGGRVREEVTWRPAIVKGGGIPLVYLQQQLYRRGQPFSKLYNRGVVEELSLRFDPDIRFGEDLLFFLEYMKQLEAVVFCAESEYNYYVAVGSGLSKSYSTFEAEYKLFLRFVELSSVLLEGQAKDAKLMEREAFIFMRALTCLYRPDSTRSRHERMIELKRAVSSLPYVNHIVGLRGWLLTHEYYGVFDFIQNTVYKMRYSGGRKIWWLICRARWVLTR